MKYPVTYPFMLESGMFMQITIPDGGTLTKSDAERICAMLKTLVLPESQPKLARKEPSHEHRTK